MWLIMILLFTLLLVWSLQAILYKTTDYAKDTHISFLTMLRDTGKLGEYYTYRALRKLPGEKRFLFNCYLPKDDATTTEVDLILLHTSGIYILESKNYSGWIFGSETQGRWTQTLPQGGSTQKNHFLNPIIQNEIHMKWLKKYLADYQELPCFSIIVFSKRCTLKNIQLLENSAHTVIRRPDLLRTVKAIANGKTLCASEQINAIYNQLFPLTQATAKQKADHIQSVNQKRFQQAKGTPALPKQPKPAASPSGCGPVCPRCGAPLVQKTAQKGNRAGKPFWGCSRFPACRYLQNIGED